MSYPDPTPPTPEEIAEHAWNVDDDYDEATYRLEVAALTGHRQHWTARDEAEEHASYVPTADDLRDEQDEIDEDRASALVDLKTEY